MNFFAPELPIRRLRQAVEPFLLAAALAGLGAPAWAQNAVTGRALFEDTIRATGIATFTGNCTSCHTSVQNRRIQIGGSAWAEISLTSAINHVGAAVATQAEMRQFQVLSAAQIQDLAAYIADTPEISTDQLDFTAATPGTTPTASQSVDLRNSVAAPATETLQVVKVEITGNGAARFRRVSDSCDLALPLPVGGSCRVTVDYSAPDTASTIVPLVFTLRQGASSSTFSRTVLLNGAVAAPAPAASNAASGGTGGGGGAMGWAWLVALAGAAAALARSQVRPKPATPLAR